MNKNDNLISGGFASIPHDEHKELSRMGGIKSGISRSKAKSLKLQLNKLLNKQINCSELPFSQLLLQEDREVSVSEALALALVYKGVVTGDPKVIEFIMKIIGEIKGNNVVEIDNNRTSTYEEALRKLLGEEF